MDDAVFLDTAGALALLNASEALHEDAARLWEEIGTTGRRIIVTDWVIAETGNSLARSRARLRFLQFVRRIQDSFSLKLVKVDEELFLKALGLYERRADKAWGLVDCASIALMEREGIRDAFTCDRHFQQAGFNCLLGLP